MIGSGPDGVLRLTAGGLEVAFWTDHTYTRNSADNVHAYEREIMLAGEDRHHRQAVGVRVSDGGAVLASAVLLLPLGCGEPGAHAIVLRPGTVYLPTGSEVAALDVPSLQVRWETRSDLGCVLALHEIPGEEALIVHGEITIARVEPDGRVAWEHSGRDIFSGELCVIGDAVEVTDWDGELYRFRISDGEILVQPAPVRPPPPRPGGWLDGLRALLRPDGPAR